MCVCNVTWHDNHNKRNLSWDLKDKWWETTAKGCREEEDIQIGRTASWHDIFKTSRLTELKHKEQREGIRMGRKARVRSWRAFHDKACWVLACRWRWISKEFYKGCIFWAMKANIFLNKINPGPQVNFRARCILFLNKPMQELQRKKSFRVV